MYSKIEELAIKSAAYNSNSLVNHPGVSVINISNYDPEEIAFHLTLIKEVSQDEDFFNEIMNEFSNRVTSSNASSYTKILDLAISKDNEVFTSDKVMTYLLESLFENSGFNFNITRPYCYIIELTDDLDEMTKDDLLKLKYFINDIFPFKEDGCTKFFRLSQNCYTYLAINQTVYKKIKSI